VTLERNFHLVIDSNRSATKDFDDVMKHYDWFWTYCKEVQQTEITCGIYVSMVKAHVVKVFQVLEEVSKVHLSAIVEKFEESKTQIEVWHNNSENIFKFSLFEGLKRNRRNVFNQSSILH
jgi:hypothetical protein